MFTIWSNGKWSNSYQFFVTYIQKLLKMYYNNWPLNAWHYDSFFLFSTYKVWLRQFLISGYIILYYIILYIYKESYWLYILISITFWLFNWYQMFYFLAKDKQNVCPIYIEWNKSFKYTHFIFWIRKLQTF